MTNQIQDRFKDTLTYTGKNVKQILADLEEVKMNIPSKVKRGDVFLSYEGKKKRPCVVIKVLKDESVLYIPITSTVNVHNLCSFNSRFFGQGWFCKNLNVISLAHVLENFIGVFDSPRDLSKGIKELKEFINSSL